jgi:hypothetical protein
VSVQPALAVEICASLLLRFGCKRPEWRAEQRRLSRSDEPILKRFLSGDIAA